MRKLSKVTTAVATGAALVLTGGVAYAYWTTTGSGTGDATASAGGGTITLYSVPGAGLAPAGSVAVVYKASSVGLPYSTKVQTLTPGTLSVDSGHAGCLASWFTASAATLVTDPTVPANTAVASAVTVANGTLSMSDTTADQSACKGATITIPVTST